MTAGRLLSGLRGLRRDCAGVTAMEFAFILPVLMMLVFATSEFGRLILVTQKLQNGTFIVADLASRDETLSEVQLDNMFLALDNLIQPFEFGASGTAIVSSVTADLDGDPMINWQRRGAGTLDQASTIGSAGDEAALPDALVLAAGETIIVAEVHYQYSPMFEITGEGAMLSKYAYVRPRLGTLEALE